MPIFITTPPPESKRAKPVENNRLAAARDSLCTAAHIR
jgi:hypothetical protein